MFGVGLSHSSDEAFVMRVERRGQVIQFILLTTTVTGKKVMKETKSQPISKLMVWNAYKKVKANNGSAGIDKVSIKGFDADLKSNLYKLWNRLASGSYFPPAVKEVSIPKPQGGERRLGIPTVADRVAQMVVKEHLEIVVEPVFDTSSYGYRPNKNAHEAIEACKIGCHENFWVIDLDIKGFFDNINHELMLKAVAKHTQEKWVLMYVERWLKAEVSTKDGLMSRDKGTPQGGVISPLLANLYLHYAFDKWLRINHPAVNFERYADDIVIHCKTKAQAEILLQLVKERLAVCSLEVHPTKTKIVYCKRVGRTDKYDTVSFDFLGFTFKPRRTKSREGKIFSGFNPGVSSKALQRMNSEVVRMQGELNVMQTIEEVAERLNPKIRGWLNYYGKFRTSDLQRLWERLNYRLIIWVRKKYKRVNRSTKQSADWLRRVHKQNPKLFVHWKLVTP